MRAEHRRGERARVRASELIPAVAVAVAVALLPIFIGGFILYTA